MVLINSACGSATLCPASNDMNHRIKLNGLVSGLFSTVSLCGSHVYAMLGRREFDDFVIFYNKRMSDICLKTTLIAENIFLCHALSHCCSLA